MVLILWRWLSHSGSGGGQASVSDRVRGWGRSGFEMGLIARTLSISVLATGFSGKGSGNVSWLFFSSIADYWATHLRSWLVPKWFGQDRRVCEPGDLKIMLRFLNEKSAADTNSACPHSWRWSLDLEISSPVKSLCSHSISFQVYYLAIKNWSVLSYIPFEKLYICHMILYQAYQPACQKFVMVSHQRIINIFSLRWSSTEGRED